MSECIQVAAVQMNALKENFEHNLQVHRRIAREAAAVGCRLVLFPELSVTAHYGEASVTSPAEEAGHGPAYEAMHALARARGNACRRRSSARSFPARSTRRPASMGFLLRIMPSSRYTATR